MAQILLNKPNTAKSKLVLATGNAGKAREFAAMLGDVFDFVLQSELELEPAEETGNTFLENALLKARGAAAQSGLAAIGDDSGLEVDALDGAPGVRSARYAGEAASDADNVQLLLQRLQDISAEQRSARFRCVLAMVESADDPEPLIAEGSWEGSIARAPRGNKGFGYDPVFIDNDSGLTAAELEPELKNARSHRANAVKKLCTSLGDVTKLTA